MSTQLTLSLNTHIESHSRMQSSESLLQVFQRTQLAQNVVQRVDQPQPSHYVRSRITKIRFRLWRDRLRNDNRLVPRLEKLALGGMTLARTQGMRNPRHPRERLLGL